ncbi:MAG TPA: glycosyltransferase, partial [Casimicrobiaceae bacterium]|nr:glycosyltransferase [Casimicrobiaceae bacterium]
MRICLVTPFAWSQPHDVNDHVAGVAGALRSFGHQVTVLAPSTRAADLLAGRRALARGEEADVIALGPAVPVSRRSQLGVPVGVQANLRQALAQGRYDVVHGFEPGLPSLSYLALRDADAFAVATFVSPNRLGYPPARSQREKLLGRIDALVALAEDVRVAAEERFPGDYRVLSPGVDTKVFAPDEKQKTIVVELRPNERLVARGVVHALRELPGWDALLLRTRPLIGRPAIPRDLAQRVHLRTARDTPARAAILNQAAIFVPGVEGVRRVTLEAAASGCAIVRPRGIETQHELAAAATARLAEDGALREREAAAART